MVKYIYFFSFKPNIDVQESINFLESELNREISDNYTLALITYALSFVGSPKAKEALNMLTWRAEQQGNAWGPSDIVRLLSVINYIHSVRKFYKPDTKLIMFAFSEWVEN